MPGSPDELFAMPESCACLTAILIFPMLPRSNIRVHGLFVVTGIAISLFCSCGGGAKNEEPARSTNPVDPSGVNAPLRAFSQEITSAIKSLKLQASGTTELPVTIRNSGQELLASTGKFPITISYKWFADGEMLPLEGERTLLPQPLKPGETVDVKVRVVAPAAGKTLTLRISLVQEGVDWFMSNGATPLELPVTLGS